jgi:hypothetical protein
MFEDCLPPGQFFVHYCLFYTEPFTAYSKALFTATICEQPEVAYAHEPAGQDMHEEAADEFHRCQGHGLSCVVMGVVGVGKGDLFTVERDNAVFGYRDTVRVTSEVFDDGFGVCKGRFNVDDPVFAVEGIDKG